MTPTEQSFGGHENCRASEFARWPRVALEHEREYLSWIMSTSAALNSHEERRLIVHDLTDIDAFLSLLEPKVKL
jgi:hypothetical protein